MALITHIEREIATGVTHQPIGGIGLPALREIGYSASAVYISSISNIRETATITSRTQELAYTSVLETARIISNISSSNNSTVIIREAALIPSRTYGARSVSHTQRDTALSYSLAIDTLNTSVRDTATINGRAAFFIDTSTRVRGTANIFSKPLYMVTAVARVIANSFSRPTTVTTNTTIARETANVIGSYVLSVTLNNTLRESAVVLSTPSTVVSTGINIKDTAFISAIAILPAIDNGIAYTCSTQTWGMSKYTNFPFSYMTDSYLSKTNLYDRTGVTDNNVNINAHIQTNQIDFGLTANKSVDNIYLNSIFNTNLFLEVSGETNKKELISHTFTVTGKKVSLGKAYSSRYYQFKLSSVGVPFSLLDMEAHLREHRRRV